MHEKRQRMIEEQQDKSLQENHIRKLNISTDLKKKSNDPFMLTSHAFMANKDVSSSVHESINK